MYLYVSILLVFSTYNIKAGFRATGIHPINRKKYCVDRLDKMKLKTYEAWVASDKQRNNENNIILLSISDGAQDVSARQSHVPEDDNPDTSTSQSAPLPWTSNEAPNPLASLIPEKGTPDHSIFQI